MYEILIMGHVRGTVDTTSETSFEGCFKLGCGDPLMGKMQDVQVVVSNLKSSEKRKPFLSCFHGLGTHHFPLSPEVWEAVPASRGRGRARCWLPLQDNAFPYLLPGKGGMLRESPVFPGPGNDYTK